MHKKLVLFFIVSTACPAALPDSPFSYAAPAPLIGKFLPLLGLTDDQTPQDKSPEELPDDASSVGTHSFASSSSSSASSINYTVQNPRVGHRKKRKATKLIDQEEKDETNADELRSAKRTAQKQPPQKEQKKTLPNFLTRDNPRYHQEFRSRKKKYFDSLEDKANASQSALDSTLEKLTEMYVKVSAVVPYLEPLVARLETATQRAEVVTGLQQPALDPSFLYQIFSSLSTHDLVKIQEIPMRILLERTQNTMLAGLAAIREQKA